MVFLAPMRALPSFRVSSGIRRIALIFRWPQFRAGPSAASTAAALWPVTAKAIPQVRLPPFPGGASDHEGLPDAGEVEMVVRTGRDPCDGYPILP